MRKDVAALRQRQIERMVNEALARFCENLHQSGSRGV
jgi:hypothetical protein